MVCYICGKEAGENQTCPHCGADLGPVIRAHRVSNTYYNEGLTKAKARNLSDAVTCLQKSLKFNKYHTDARNLLGLVYYELGEMVQALTEWVISTSLQPEDNPANTYLAQINKSKGQLGSMDTTVKKYNQAITYCREGNYDVAILQLRKVLNLTPNLVKAHQLLGLLYIDQGQYEKARRTLRAAAKIDKDNTITMRYLREAEIGAKKMKRRKKKDDLVTYRNGNETIIKPTRFRDSSLGGNVGYLILGLVVGAAVSFFLLGPAITSNAQSETSKRFLEASDTITTHEQTITALESQIESLQKERDEALASEEAADAKVSGYQSLLKAIEMYTSENDIVATGDYLDTIDSSALDEEALAAYESLSASIKDEYVQTLYSRGRRAYNNGDMESAASDLQRVVNVEISYDYGNAVYYLAQAYRRSGDDESAKEYYEYVVANYAGTQRARTSQYYLNGEQY